MPAAQLNPVNEPIAPGEPDDVNVQAMYATKFIFTRWIKHTAPLEEGHNANSVAPQIIGDDPHLVVELSGIFVSSSPWRLIRQLFAASVSRYDLYEDIPDVINNDESRIIMTSKNKWYVIECGWDGPAPAGILDDYQGETVLPHYSDSIPASVYAVLCGSFSTVL
jgi:hypothetical protein